VRSAGSTPAEEINPAVVEAMEELGLHMAKAYPKPLTDEFVRASDVVITMGSGDACPIHPGSGTRTGSSKIPPGRRSSRYGRSRRARSQDPAPPGGDRATDVAQGAPNDALG
jgi:protein-tyrosine-phosphatase